MKNIETTTDESNHPGLRPPLLEKAGSCDEADKKSGAVKPVAAKVKAKQKVDITLDPRHFVFRPKWTPKQTVALNALKRPDIKEVLYGGAKGGGKSVFGCLWCFKQALGIIKDCQIGRRKHPIPVGFMGRKRGVDFTNTTLETWKRFIPENAYVIKGKPAEIILLNCVKILTGGLDNSEIVNKFNSAEYAFYFIDQAEEVDREQIGELRATTRLIINGKKIPGKGLFTANPAPSFLKEEFILNPTDNRVFIRALGAGLVDRLIEMGDNVKRMIHKARDVLLSFLCIFMFVRSIQFLFHQPAHLKLD